MTCVTFNDDLVLAHEEEHQKAQDGSDGRKRIVFTDRYELPMHKHVRESYAGISDKEVDNWRLTSFNDAMKLEEENPQEAVDAAASSFAEAVLTAAKAGRLLYKLHTIGVRGGISSLGPQERLTRTPASLGYGSSS